ncbi:MAG TPA: hypothetical protein GX714_13030 [Chloroflexi bacterium]|nr:hypothetical protein [Chloroflexota bacterium]
MNTETTKENTGRSMAELKRQIASLDYDPLVALDMIVTAIEEVPGNHERVAALERKLAPWLNCPNASLRMLEGCIDEWRAEGLEG